MLISLSVKVITGHHETPNWARFTLPDNIRLGWDCSEAGPASCFQEFLKNEIRQLLSPTMAIRLCDTLHFQHTVKSNG